MDQKVTHGQSTFLLVPAHVLVFWPQMFLANTCLQYFTITHSGVGIKKLTDSTHMTLNHHATAQSLCGQLPPATCIGEDVADDNVPQESQEDSETLQAANPQSGQIPRKQPVEGKFTDCRNRLRKLLGGAEHWLS